MKIVRRKKNLNIRTGKKHTVREYTYCECLDFAEASYRHRIYPLLYCHLEFSGHLDIDRLKQAVNLSARIVPEILFSYSFRRGAFVNSGHTADDAVKYLTDKTTVPLRPDLSKHPQLQILITPGQGQDHVLVIMSHILTDGAGFLQYLYLLASFYNEALCMGNLYDGKFYSPKAAGKYKRNERKLSPLLKNIRVQAPTEQSRHNRLRSVPPLRPSSKGRQPFCLTAQIPEDSMKLLHSKAKRHGVTLNDIFMTAYARTIARLLNTDTAVLSCPADLRRFSPEYQELTVANMTGMYQRVAIELPAGCSFGTALQQIHLEMSLQKSRRRCFAGITILNRAFHKTPRPLLEQIIKAVYRASPVSYTNFGIVDHEKLRFNGCTLQNCFFTGAYRLPPDFQLTISTFKNVCTLNCTLLGIPNDRKNGQKILNQVKQEIEDWLKDSESLPVL
ncbi:MAG: hypothetical protein Q4C61_17380 [Lachnospiraceae bacterium]|nr:hypothetical protein [Lachnospiraceae bacterium]